MRGYLSLVLIACSVMATAASAAEQKQAVAADQCSVSATATVLQPAQMQATDARAHWLNRQLLKWPKMDGAGRFRLHYSAGARLLAEKGKPVSGADGALQLDVTEDELSRDISERFAFVADGVVLAVRSGDAQRVPDLLTQQVLLVQEDEAGRVLDATLLQDAGALDDVYAGAAQEPALGVSAGPQGTGFKLWAPTARRVSLCLQAQDGTSVVPEISLRLDPATGIWSTQQSRDLSGNYYTYLVDVVVPGLGVVRNRVTDPYSISLDANSKRSYIANLDAPALKPEGWDAANASSKVAAQTDMVIYELHVRDFSINDASVTPANRGKYAAGDARYRDRQHFRFTRHARRRAEPSGIGGDHAVKQRHQPLGRPFADHGHRLRVGNDCAGEGSDSQPGVHRDAQSGKPEPTERVVAAAVRLVPSISRRMGRVRRASSGPFSDCAGLGLHR